MQQARGKEHRWGSELVHQRVRSKVKARSLDLVHAKSKEQGARSKEEVQS